MVAGDGATRSAAAVKIIGPLWVMREQDRRAERNAVINAGGGGETGLRRSGDHNYHGAVKTTADLWSCGKRDDEGGGSADLHYENLCGIG